MRQRGLAQTGRAEQQHVIERLAPLARSGDEDLHLLADLGLAHVLGQPLRTQRALHRLFVGRCGLTGDDAFDRHVPAVPQLLASDFSASRMPSMMQAWFSSSEMMMSPGSARVGNTASLAVHAETNEYEASVPM